MTTRFWTVWMAGSILACSGHGLEGDDEMLARVKHVRAALAAAQERGVVLGDEESEAVFDGLGEFAMEYIWLLRRTEFHPQLRQQLAELMVRKIVVDPPDVGLAARALTVLKTEDFGVFPRDQLTNLMDRWASGEGEANDRVLLVAALARIPKALDVAKRFVPDIGKEVRVSKMEWAAVVVAARYGDDERARQAVRIAEGLKRIPPWFKSKLEDLALTAHRDVVEYLRCYMVSEEKLWSSDFDAVERGPWPHAAVALARMLGGFPVREVSVDSMTLEERGLCGRWIEEQTTFEFR